MEAAIKAHEFMITESQGRESMKAVLIGMKTTQRNHQGKPGRRTPRASPEQVPQQESRGCSTWGGVFRQHSSSDPKEQSSIPYGWLAACRCQQAQPFHASLFLSPNASRAQVLGQPLGSSAKGSPENPTGREEGRPNTKAASPEEIVRKCPRTIPRTAASSLWQPLGSERRQAR